MSYFEDQEDAWMQHDCQGDISDVDPYDPDWRPKPNKPQPRPPTPPNPATRTKSQKNKDRIRRVKARKLAAQCPSPTNS